MAEAKTIRVRLSKYNVSRTELVGWRSLKVALTDEQIEAIGDRDIEVTITPVASPEERLREARIWEFSLLPRDASVQQMLEAVERVDAEFAKGEK